MAQHFQKLFLGILLILHTVSCDDDEECPHVRACECEITSDGVSYMCEVGSNGDILSVNHVPRSNTLIIQCDVTDSSFYTPGLLNRFSSILNTGQQHEIRFKLCPFPNLTFGTLMSDLNISSIHFTGSEINVLNLTKSDVLSGLDSLRHITFRGTHFVDVPNTLFKPVSKTLESVVLSGNLLSTLPNGLFNLTTNLKVLNLGYNQIGALTKPLGKLSLLTKLYLHSNDMESIGSDVFRGLKNVLTLDLQGNKLQELPKEIFHPLSRLETLKLFANDLRMLPDELFANNANLHEIDLSDNHLLTELPPHLFQNLKRLKSVKLYRCNLNTVPSSVFQNLPNLANVELNSNQLFELPRDAFDKSTVLETLRLDDNAFIELPEKLLAEQQNLTTLTLDKNGLQFLTDNFLDDLWSLRTLRISNNRLQNLTSSFVSLSNLEMLDLRNNSIKLVDPNTFVPLSNLTTLDISRNRLQTIEFQLPQSLRNLNVSHNKLTEMPLTWQLWLQKLLTLDLSYNFITFVSASQFQFSSMNVVVDLQHNTIATIDLTDMFTPPQDNVNDARPLVRLGHNPVNCDCKIHFLVEHVKRQTQGRTDVWFRTDVTDLSCALPVSLKDRRIMALENTKTLKCEITHDCDPSCKCYHDAENVRDVQCLGLEHLPTIVPDNVTLLNLTKNRLQALNGIEASNWSSLNVLILSNNNLSGLNNTFPLNVKELYLDGNNIRELSIETLNEFSNKTLTILKLGNNPWNCDCKNKTLQKWLDSVAFVADSFAMLCANIKNTTVSRYRCPEPQRSIHGLIAGLVISAIAIATVFSVAGIAYYKYLHEMRVWLYSQGWCLWLVSEKDIDADKEFDAFISFSQEDVDWVVKELVPELEHKDPSYRLCVHQRDWIVGEWIPDQIVRSVESSCRTIVVLSQNFLKSVWGRMEFKTAHHQALKDRMNRVIVIVLGEIPPKDEMDPEMRLYVGLNTYLTWGDPWFWKKLRYALPHRVNGDSELRSRNKKFWVTPINNVIETTQV